MQNKDISAFIVTFNCENYLRDCLSSISWVNEIIVLDLGSNDETLEIAREYDCRIHMHEWVPIQELVRQEAIDACTSEWLLEISPDERITSSLATQLKQIANQDELDGVSIPFKNYMFGRHIMHTGLNSEWHTRFFRRGTVSYSKQVHSPEQVQGKVITLPATEDNYMHHINYETITQFVEKLNRYTGLEVDKLKEKSSDISMSSAVRAPFKEFGTRYFEGAGYKDGMQGLAVSELRAAYQAIAYMKYVENRGWTNLHTHKRQCELSGVREGVLLGIWDLLKGMEASTNTPKLQIIYRIIRRMISICIRIRAY